MKSVNLFKIYLFKIVLGEIKLVYCHEGYLHFTRSSASFVLQQVYYWALRLESPLSMKSSGLQRLYSDMRHPGTTALTLMLLVHPHMTASRVLLSLVMVLYALFRSVTIL